MMWKNVRFFLSMNDKKKQNQLVILYGKKKKKKMDSERDGKKCNTKSMTPDILCMYESISFRQTYVNYYLYIYILFALKFVLLCLNSNVASSVTCIVDVSMHENINNRMRAEIWM